MLTDARQKMIEAIAMRDGEVIISRIAKELNVSIETIRRDINVLCARNILTKVHGGAVPVNLPIAEASYNQRKNTNSKLKNKLGQYAADMIQNNQVVALSTGSTIEAVAMHINGVQHITAITNSIPISEILCESNGRNGFNGKVILLGGRVNLTEHLTYGPAVNEQADRYYADILFVSAGAVNETGLMSTGPDEGAVSTKMIACAGKKVLIIESKKLSKRSVYRFAKLEDIDMVITDDTHEINAELYKAFTTAGIEVHIVK